MLARNRGATLILAVALVLRAEGVQAQEPIDVRDAGSLDALLQRALDANPAVAAARHRVEASRAAVSPAGALEDPMLMVGLMNQPLGSTAGMEEGMAMRVVGASQLVPFPGKRGLRRTAAEREVGAAEAELDAARRAVVADVKEAFYELAFLARSMEVLDANDAVLRELIRITEARYGVGTGGQRDVLEARVELASLAKEAVVLVEETSATLARLNTALDRPTDTPVPAATIPSAIASAAIPEDPARIGFVSARLGARASDSPLPPLTTLREEAVAGSPALRAHDARIAAQAARVELARRAYLPDLELSLEYGQRDRLPDLVSAVVSFPVPIGRAGRQDLEVREAEAMLAQMRAERAATANEIRAEVAEIHANAERARAQLALLAASILPQGRAALEAAMTSFQVGAADFMTVLENQATLYGYETAYHRALADFATQLARLERLVGKEIL